MKKGNGSQSTYDIRNIRAYAEAYLETGVGYSRPITDKLTVGGKVKLLWGVGSMDATIDQMHAEMGETSWKVTSTGTLQTNMKGLVPEMEVDEQGRDYYNSFDFDSPGLSGFGMGVDLGATYQLTENIMLSAAVLDLGFISWSKGGSTVGKLDGTFDFNGFDLAIGENNGDIPAWAISLTLSRKISRTCFISRKRVSPEALPVFVRQSISVASTVCWKTS